MNNILECSQSCCKYDISHWSRPKVQLDPTKMQMPKNRKKAGVLLHDPETDKVLLVQSCGNYWGPPKGTVEEEESYESCAARELKDETGLVVPEEAYKTPLFVKSNAVYFHYKTKELPVTIQNNGIYNDANGIGWFKVECIKKMVKEGKIRVNQHLKLVFKKVFDIVLA